MCSIPQLQHERCCLMRDGVPCQLPSPPPPHLPLWDDRSAVQALARRPSFPLPPSQALECLRQFNQQLFHMTGMEWREDEFNSPRMRELKCVRPERGGHGGHRGRGIGRAPGHIPRTPRSAPITAPPTICSPGRPVTIPFQQ